MKRKWHKLTKFIPGKPAAPKRAKALDSDIGINDSYELPQQPEPFTLIMRPPL